MSVSRGHNIVIGLACAAVACGPLGGGDPTLEPPAHTDDTTFQTPLQCTPPTATSPSGVSVATRWVRTFADTRAPFVAADRAGNPLLLRHLARGDVLEEYDGASGDRIGRVVLPFSGATVLTANPMTGGLAITALDPADATAASVWTSACDGLDWTLAFQCGGSRCAFAASPAVADDGSVLVFERDAVLRLSSDRHAELPLPAGTTLEGASRAADGSVFLAVNAPAGSSIAGLLVPDLGVSLVKLSEQLDGIWLTQVPGLFVDGSALVTSSAGDLLWSAPARGRGVWGESPLELPAPCNGCAAGSLIAGADADGHAVFGEAHLKRFDVPVGQSTAGVMVFADSGRAALTTRTADGGTLGSVEVQGDARPSSLVATSLGIAAAGRFTGAVTWGATPPKAYAEGAFLLWIAPPSVAAFR